MNDVEIARRERVRTNTIRDTDCPWCGTDDTGGDYCDKECEKSHAAIIRLNTKMEVFQNG